MGVTVNQTNSGNQPVYKSTSFGSKPAVRFDGIDDVLNLTPIRSTAGGYSVYVATRRHDTLGDTNAYIIDEAGWSLIADVTNTIWYKDSCSVCSFRCHPDQSQNW